MILRLKILSCATSIFFKVQITLLLVKLQRQNLHLKLTIGQCALLLTPTITVTVTVIVIVVIIAIVTTVFVSFVWRHLETITQILVNVRNNHKIIRRVKAYDRHMNL